MTVKVSTAIHPGEHIAEELEARGRTSADLARAMGLDRGRVSRLVNGRTAVTAETAILLSDVFGTSAEFWIRLQGDYDLAVAREARP
jgi:addiction module HigA family antidote